MMLGQAKKKLIIVVDEKSAVYGELLSALITMKNEGNFLNAETVIWSEKIYADNQAQLGSGNKIVFVGKSETAKTVISNVICKTEYTDYGLCYGYASNKAVIYADDVKLSADKEKYEAFYAAYSELLTENGTDFALNQIKAKVEIKSENIAESEKEHGKFATKALGVFHKIDKATAKGISVLVNTKDILDQQYRMAVFAFYMKMLVDFMGE